MRLFWPSHGDFLNSLTTSYNQRWGSPFEMTIWGLQYDVIQNGDEKVNDKHAERKRSASMHMTTQVHQQISIRLLRRTQWKREQAGNVRVTDNINSYLISIEAELRESVVLAESSLALFRETCISLTTGLMFNVRSLIFTPPISPPQAALGPERPRVGLRRKSEGRAFPSSASFLVLII